MNDKDNSKPIENRRPVDFPLLIVTIALVCFGIIMVFSSSFYYAEIKFGSPYYFVSKQLIGAVIGFVGIFVLVKIPYKMLKKFAMPFMGFCLLLLVVVLIIGDPINGAKRWIEIAGVSVQVAEIAKFGLILFMADSLAKRQDKLPKFRTGLLPYILLLGMVCGLIMLQPNFSMVICITATWFVLICVGGTPKKHVLVMVGILVVSGVFIAFGASYRVSRLLTYLDPWANASGSGYQVIQSLYGIASGGIFGVGIGNSRQKMLFLPYRESDFIFSIIAEEIGFIGVMLLLGVYLFLFWRGVIIAINCPDLFGTLVAAGVVGSIAVQVFLNIAVAIKLLPATGLTLPFISSGMTSLVVMLCNVGLLLNVSRLCSPRRRKKA